MMNLLCCLIFFFTSFTMAQCLCSDDHCHHICGEKFHCVSHSYDSTHGCECLPHDYCDAEFSCRPSDAICSHNEPIRCGRNNKCECYCSQDSQCQNCSDGTLGFCVKDKCICESRSYCPGGNKFYCLKNFQCAHNESKRCNTNERCECYCDIDTDCKNCPEKGFCVDGGCVCESQNYCTNGNHFYCLFMNCANGYTGKCNSTNHCYCAYVPDTCSGQDVSKCFHLSCSIVEKKYCEGRTCTCKPIDYCKQNDADCRHKTCDASKPEVNACLNSTCSCLVIPDFCGGDDTSTCQHLHCNPYQVKKCDNGMCKCQVNPSCNSNAGLRNNTCTPENTYLEVKGANGKVYYANCTDENHYPLCVDGRCNCVYWKTMPPLTSPGTTSSGGLVTDTTSSAFTIPDTTTTQQSLVTTTASATCSSRKDCNQQNTFAVFLTFHMPCPVDHIDCVDNSCTCSLYKITTTPPPTTTTTTTTDGHWSDWMHWSSCSATCGIGTKTRSRICNNPAPLNGGKNCFGNVSEMQTCVEAICHVGPECPTCDVNLNCHWNSVCDVSEVCMIRSYLNTTFSVHCTKREDCDFIKTVLPNAEIYCCNNRSCLNSYLGLS